MLLYDERHKLRDKWNTQNIFRYKNILSCKPKKI